MEIIDTSFQFPWQQPLFMDRLGTSAGQEYIYLTTEVPFEATRNLFTYIMATTIYRHNCESFKMRNRNHEFQC